MAFNTQSVKIGTSSSSPVELVAAKTGKRIVVVNYVLTNSVATAQSFFFASGTTALTGTIGLPSSIGGGISASAAEPHALLYTNEGEALNIDLTAATAVAGHLAYRYE